MLACPLHTLKTHGDITQTDTKQTFQIGRTLILIYIFLVLFWIGTWRAKEIMTICALFDVVSSEECGWCLFFSGQIPVSQIGPCPAFPYSAWETAAAPCVMETKQESMTENPSIPSL